MDGPAKGRSGNADISGTMARAANIAWFVSPHGFGHAARSAAVAGELLRTRRDVEVHLFTTVPDWFFSGISASLKMHPYKVDIGLVQRDAMVADMPATLTALDEFLPFDEKTVERLARQVYAVDAALVVCDIAPLGIAVAERAGLPSVLLENFTWDWIYRGLGETGFEGFSAYFADWFERADYRIQTEPLCEHRSADLLIPPISRPLHESRSTVRQALDIGEEEKLVFCSMGGNSQQFPAVRRMKIHWPNLRFVIAGGEIEDVDDNVTLIPHHSEFDHPSLVAASDLVVGKLGYSTIAEVFNAGVPFCGFSRPDYSEMPPLEKFVREKMPAKVFGMQDFESGDWLNAIPHMLELGQNHPSAGGAGLCASFLEKLLPPARASV